VWAGLLGVCDIDGLSCSRRSWRDSDPKECVSGAQVGLGLILCAIILFFVAACVSGMLLFQMNHDSQARAKVRNEKLLAVLLVSSLVGALFCLVSVGVWMSPQGCHAAWRSSLSVQFNGQLNDVVATRSANFAAVT
jgi:hypothetical protein